VRKPNPDLHADRRGQILKAAMAVFARKGLHKATMPDIAAAAGMSAANLYHYVKSKDAILQVMAQEDRRESMQILAALAEADDLVNGLLAIIDEYLPQQDDSEIVVGIEILAEACRNPVMREAFATLDREVRDALAMLIKRAQARGQVDSDLEPHAAAAVILDLGESSLGRRIFDPAYDVAGGLTELKRMLTAYLRPKGGKSGGKRA
jgi:AcrR family transcriptional regulator